MIIKAKLSDAKQIQKLTKHFSDKGEMLPRSLIQIYENIRDFYVAKIDKQVVGVCALHITWENLAEIRSLAVSEKFHKKGIGSELVKACLNEANELELNQIFVLTYKPDFFKKFGFSIIEKSKLPHKVWQDCLNCHKFPDCNEIAMRLIL